MKNTKEYSKRIISRMIILWFIGAAFGASVVAVEIVATFAGLGEYTAVTVHLPELLAYIGAPITGGIVGYLIKSAMENKEKIKNNSVYERGFSNEYSNYHSETHIP